MIEENIVSKKEVAEEAVVKRNFRVALIEILKVPDFMNKHLDVDARLRLRKTCYILRKILDTNVPFIEHLTFMCEGSLIEIEIDGGLLVSYEPTTEGVLIKHKQGSKLVITSNEVEKYEMIRTELMTIFGNEKLNIGTFKVQENRNFSIHDEKAGMKLLKYILDMLPHQLKVGKLDYKVLETEFDFCRLMESMDPNHCKSFQVIHDYYSNEDDGKTLATVYQTDQWKSLKSVCIDEPTLFFKRLIDDCTHVEIGHFHYQSISYDEENQKIEDIFPELIEKLLQNPNLKQFRINMHQQFDKIRHRCN